MGKQPTQGQKKTKDQIEKAASSRSKQTKKKWTKGKTKEKLNNAVFLEKAQYDNITAQLPKIGKLVTVAVVSDKFKINGSLARKVLRHFHEKGVLQVVGDSHHTQTLYTVSASAMVAKKDGPVEATTKAQQGGKGQQKKGGKQ